MVVVRDQKTLKVIAPGWNKPSSFGGITLHAELLNIYQIIADREFYIGGFF
jgi:hypothetical protein